MEPEEHESLQSQKQQVSAKEPVGSARLHEQLVLELAKDSRIGLKGRLV